MTKTIQFPPSDDLEKIIRKRILDHAKALNTSVMERIVMAANHLDASEHRAALGALDGIEQVLTTLRCFLLLIA